MHPKGNMVAATSSNLKDLRIEAKRFDALFIGGNCSCLLRAYLSLVRSSLSAQVQSGFPWRLASLAKV